MKKINAKNKGSSYERKIASEHRNLGFDKCVTARFESKRRDDEKVDLCFTSPFNVQCKATENINFHTELKKMPDEKNYNLVFNKKNRKGEVVAMWKEDWYEIVEMLIKNKIIKI